MLLPICVLCQREMRPEKNGVAIEYLDEAFRSYKILSGDMWKCEMCGNRIVVGFSGLPIAERGRLNYTETLATYPDRIKVYV